MGRGLRIGMTGLALVGALVALGAVLMAGSGAATLRGCHSFKTQAEGEEYFLEHGGTPHRDFAHLDGDHDGVACEALGGSYVGYATIGYNRRRHFFYGTATMPPGSPTPAEPPCLSGNKHYPNGPRRLEVFRVSPTGDKRVFSKLIPAEPRPGSDRMLWKANLASLRPGVYYAEFEEKVRLRPYGPIECPVFSSRPTRLPPVRASR